MRKFTLTEEHVRLLQHSNIEFNDSMYYGSFGQDAKRPYGNSDVVGDIARILGITPIGDEDEEEREWPDGTETRCLNLHEEAATALQIVLATKSFEPGVYVASDYRDDWRSA